MMRLLLAVSIILGAVSSAPQSYTTSSFSSSNGFNKGSTGGNFGFLAQNNQRQNSGGGVSSQKFGGIGSSFSTGHTSSGGSQSGYGGGNTNVQSQGSFGGATASCGEGEIANAAGECVKPIVTRNVFVFAAPEVQVKKALRPNIPSPKIDYNIVFVRTPEIPEGEEPIVVPPPQQKTLVYVLNKNSPLNEQQVIEVPSGPAQQPEVYYVNYEEGDNPSLPGGLSLQEALSSANSQQGQVLGGNKAAPGVEKKPAQSYGSSNSRPDTNNFNRYGK